MSQWSRIQFDINDGLTSMNVNNIFKIYNWNVHMLKVIDMNLLSIVGIRNSDSGMFLETSYITAEYDISRGGFTIEMGSVTKDISFEIRTKPIFGYLAIGY